MTSLETKLASILALIEHARATKDALALAALLQRKDAICAALAAPEHSWCTPSEPATIDELETPVALVA
jgi:hypothetical protein